MSGWLTSSHSDTTNCVQVLRLPEDTQYMALKGGEPAPILIRDSRDLERALAFRVDDWDAFVEGVKAGEFDSDRLPVGEPEAEGRCAGG